MHNKSDKHAPKYVLFLFLCFKDFAKDRYGVSALVQSQQKLG